MKQADEAPYSAATAARAFERRHRQAREPWMYGDRAAEILRHQWIVDAAIDAAPELTLDVGCTAGQLTARLARALPNVLAVDVSPTAVVTARQRADREAHRATFASGSVLTLPFRESAFDLIVAADGLYSWDLSEEDRAAALQELFRVLRPNGRIIFTDHMRPVRFREFIREIEQSPFSVRDLRYLYDRPWYQFESWFRALQRFGFVSAIRRNLMIARILSLVGRAFGPTASRHICIAACKPGAVSS